MSVQNLSLKNLSYPGLVSGKEVVLGTGWVSGKEVVLAVGLVSRKEVVLAVGLVLSSTALGREASCERTGMGHC